MCCSREEAKPTKTLHHGDKRRGYEIAKKILKKCVKKLDPWKGS
jgi:hypothetical protein